MAMQPVYVSGMFRSGSTWSFNVVRELLLLRYDRKQLVTSVVDDLVAALDAPENAGKLIIAKGHEPTNESVELLRSGEVIAVHTLRNPADAIRSGMRAFGFSYEAGLRLVMRALEVAAILKEARQGAVIVYDEIALCPHELVRNIANLLRIDACDAEIDRIVEKLQKDKLRAFTEALSNHREEIERARTVVDVGFSWYDAETLLHRSHISSANYLEEYRLTPEQFQDMVERCGPFVDLQGRLVQTQSEFGNLMPEDQNVYAGMSVRE